MHFWQVQTRLRGGMTSPVKNFFIGAMPELMRSRDLSPFGTSEKLGKRRCPLLSKNERYFSRKSLRDVHFICISSKLNTKVYKTTKNPRRKIASDEKSCYHRDSEFPHENSLIESVTLTLLREHPSGFTRFRFLPALRDCFITTYQRLAAPSSLCG